MRLYTEAAMGHESGCRHAADCVEVSNWDRVRASGRSIYQPSSRRRWRRSVAQLGWKKDHVRRYVERAVGIAKEKSRQG